MVRRFIALTCLLLLTLACAGSSASFDRPAGGAWDNRGNIDLMVRVQNQHYSVVRIDAVWEHMEYFLGEVGPDSERMFRLPGYLLVSQGKPRFRADPRNSASELLSSPIECGQARTVEWRLKRNLHPSRPHVMVP